MKMSEHSCTSCIPPNVQFFCLKVIFIWWIETHTHMHTYIWLTAWHRAHKPAPILKHTHTHTSSIVLPQLPRGEATIWSCDRLRNHSIKASSTHSTWLYLATDFMVSESWHITDQTRVISHVPTQINIALHASTLSDKWRCNVTNLSVQNSFQFFYSICNAHLTLWKKVSHAF